MILTGNHLQTLIDRWGRWRRLDDSRARQAVEEWRLALGVPQSVRLERIRCHQVTNERGEPGCSLVGVAHDAEAACIYHTRTLAAEDIVHELLHVTHPAWSEAEVVAETDSLLGRQTGRKRQSRPCPQTA